MKVALYLRRSTNERLQADSLRVQEQILRAYANDHKMTVTVVFKDSASGTSVKKRHQFLSMVEAITHGPDFEAILVRDVSRFGRFFDPDEGAFWEMLFLGHQVRTIYVEEVFGSDTTPMASLIKSVRRVMASEFSRDKSRMVRYGQSRVAGLGFWASGPPPYGTRRVMVERDGNFVQKLEKGEWKNLANRRSKLVKGDPAQVATVQKIYALYGEDGWGSTQICAHLNAEKTQPPQGSRWWEPTVRAILENPVYIGTASYHVRWKGPTDPLPESAVTTLSSACHEAFEPVVSSDLWLKVQNRIQNQTNRRSDEDLATDLRDALVLHGCVEANMLETLPSHCSFATYAIRFGSADIALRLAYGAEIKVMEVRLVQKLTDSFSVVQQENEFLIDGVLRLKIQAAFPHANQWSQRWRFSDEPGDHHLVLGFGIHPDGTSTDHIYVLRRERLTSHVRGLMLPTDSKKKPRAGTVVNLAGLPEAVARLRFGVSSGAEAVFIETVTKLPLMNFSEVSRLLGWPMHSVRTMYWHLVNRGEPLPPMKNKAGRLIKFICGRCGVSRWELPNRALARRGDLCVVCCRKPKQLILIRCPGCGREAKRWPSQIAKLSAGANSPCVKCSQKLKSVSEGHD